MKKIKLVRLQPFAMYNWSTSKPRWKSLSTVPDLPIVPVERACSSRSGGASGNSGPVGELRMKTTDLACAMSSVDVFFD